MIVLAAFAWLAVGFAQVAPPLPVPPITTQPAGAPDVSAPSPGGNTRVQTTTAPAETSDARIERIGVVLADGVAKSGAKGSQELLTKAWDLPQALLNRNRENTIDETHAAQENDALLSLIPGLTVAGVALAAALALLAGVSGRDFGPLASFRAMGTVGFGAGMAANNRQLLGMIVDGAAIVLQAVAVAPIREFASPGLGVSTFTTPIIGAVLTIVYCLVVLFLIVVLSIELGWVMVLSGLAPLWMLARFFPMLEGVGSYFGQRWFGSLLSPLLALTALNMGSLMIGSGNGQAEPIDQLKRLMFIAIAYQSPGFMVGAIGVKIPGVQEAYFASRLLGAGRYSPPSTGGGSASAPPLPTPAMTAPVPTAVSGQNRGAGGGNAATNRARPGVP